MMLEWVPTLVLIVTCGLIALGSLFVLAALQTETARNAGAIFVDRAGGTHFLFDGDHLLDATPSARALLGQIGQDGQAWRRLLAYITPRFPEFEGKLSDLPDDGRLTLTETLPDGSLLSVEAEMRGGLTRIVLHESDTGSGGQDVLTQKAMQQELTTLRRTLAQTPLLIWRENTAHEVVWANASYLNEAAARLEPGRDLTWPQPRLFETRAIPASLGQTSPQHGQAMRLSLGATDGGEARWYDLTLEDMGDERLFFATPCDTAVKAETALRDFTQTLTKTFAHLPIGLAIFDRQRQLALFNPALLDLCNLPPDFLSARPTLFAFLDAMRDRNMIPEPKDYRTWRKQMTALEKEASAGLFEETWSLPSGQTYRLVGRPHPNGALALMFEDISTEINRIRRYRADLELGQSVLDAMDQAVAVFSSGGALLMTNARYADLWGHDPAATVGQGTLAQICTWWRDRSAPTTFWSEVEVFCEDSSNCDTLIGEVRLLDGRLIGCQLRGLPGKATLVKFDLAGHRAADTLPIADDLRLKRA